MDSSVVAAALIHTGPDASWAETVLLSDDVFAPVLMHYETANVIRRATARGDIDRSAGAAAFGDLRALPITMVPFELTAQRSWELRDTITMYDGAFVAAAELVKSPLYTLDRRLAQAPGPRCRIITP
ncbi:type II toxin-antitoxin system VapC family toxin [Gordonia spumicola]|uniref:type II toxin-antitoxin system VapC family toxin n=1 Tax=Gordonia spumicola TaxID=589161 RepID=UPI00137B2F23|nr:type II toxin-antitoxin system VapC family toxin [Gordonia spumicola]